eukprot:g4303.t1
MNILQLPGGSQQASPAATPVGSMSPATPCVATMQPMQPFHLGLPPVPGQLQSPMNGMINQSPTAQMLHQMKMLQFGAVGGMVVAALPLLQMQSTMAGEQMKPMEQMQGFPHDHSQLYNQLAQQAQLEAFKHMQMAEHMQMAIMTQQQLQAVAQQAGKNDEFFP